MNAVQPMKNFLTIALFSVGTFIAAPAQAFNDRNTLGIAGFNVGTAHATFALSYPYRNSKNHILTQVSQLQMITTGLGAQLPIETARTICDIQPNVAKTLQLDCNKLITAPDTANHGGQLQQGNPPLQSQSSANTKNNGKLVNPVQYDPSTGHKIIKAWVWDDNPHVERSPRTVRADYQAMQRIRDWERRNIPAESQWYFNNSDNPEQIWTHPANEGFNRPGGNFWEPGYIGVSRDVHGQVDQVGKLGVSKSGTPDAFSDPGTAQDQINGVNNLIPHPSVVGLQIGSNGWGIYKGRRVKSYSPLNPPSFESGRSGAIEFALHVPGRDGGTSWYYQ